MSERARGAGWCFSHIGARWFGQRGFEGKIAAAGFARENKSPYLGICYGMHAAVIDVARNLAGLEKANSTEIDLETDHPVIASLQNGKIVLVVSKLGQRVMI